MKAQISLEYLILTAGIISAIGIMTATTFNTLDTAKENYTKKTFEETIIQIKEKTKIVREFANGTKTTLKPNITKANIIKQNEECIIKIQIQEATLEAKIENTNCKNSEGKTIKIEKQNNETTISTT